MHKVGVEELDKLLVEEPILGACVPSVLLEDRREAPALQLAQAANHRACTMAAEITHDEKRVARRVEQQPQALENSLFRDGLERAPLAAAAVLSQVHKVNVLILEPHEQ